MRDKTVKKNKPKEFEVKNLKGTSSGRYASPPKRCTSWLNYWEKRTKVNSGNCHCCNNVASLGAHIFRIGENYTKEWYIVPLCDACNKIQDIFTVKGPLVPVNTKKKYRIKK